jgi:hypothetical protein
MRSLKLLLLEQAHHVGPSATRVVQAIWADTAIEAARDACQILRLARCYGTQRLEAACKRSAFYQRHTNSFVIEWILRERFDELPLTRCTDIRGQFAFAIPEINGDCDGAK